MMQMDFRYPTAADAVAINEIHRAGLTTGHASFRIDPYQWIEFENLYLNDRGLAIVAEGEGTVSAWAGVIPVSDRCVYAGVGEVSIYVSPIVQGRGIGRLLLQALVSRSEERGYWTLVAQIFPENQASISLHKACGFKVVGQRKQIGRMSYGPLEGQWRDTIMLERRSKIVGCD